MDPLSLKPQLPGQAQAALSGFGASKGGGANAALKEEFKRLAKACSEFEALFIEQLFKTMRATVPASGLLRGGRAEEIYTGLLDQQIAEAMARGQGSLGLASQMQSRLLTKETRPQGPELP